MRLAFIALLGLAGCHWVLPYSSGKDGAVAADHVLAPHDQREIAPPYDIAPTPIDLAILPPPADFTPMLFDLPSTPGSPCPMGACGGGLTCVTMICRKTCAPPPCNQAQSPCANNEACVAGTTFSGACVPASAKLGQFCNATEALCVPGALCVASTCRTACGGPVGCPTPYTCTAVSATCSACVPL
jgi:hypothetical protein